MTQQNYNRYQWLLFTAALMLPILAWGQNLNWQISTATGYQWFPLFGLVAWMIMWSHYITGGIRIRSSGLKKSGLYARLSAWLVLFCMLMHPALLVYTQYQNTNTLPPESYINYVGEGLALAVMLGTVSLLIFLSFEVFERLKHKPIIKKNWRFISLSQSLAMVLIFVHALRLGSIATNGWFAVVWAGCGLLLVPCFYLIHSLEFSEQQSA
jgi:predicted ferric reductase